MTRLPATTAARRPRARAAVTLALVLAPALLAACATRRGATPGGAAAGTTRPAPAASPLGADTSDTALSRHLVLAVVRHLFDAMAARDSAGMGESFAPGARLVGMRTRADGSVVMQSLPWERFAGMAANDTRATWTERVAGEPEVRVRGSLATVWAHYTFHFGDAPSHCGVDAVQLLRTTAGWRIVSIADTYERTGCPWNRDAKGGA